MNCKQDLGTNVQQLKSSLDIVTVAADIGILPPKSGRLHQGGKCPNGHKSEGGKCFAIYPDTQSAHCFHCGKSWDVIGLVQEVKKMDFMSACNRISDKYHLSRIIQKDMTPEEKAKHEARLDEERTVFSILTAAAQYYHKRLMSDPEMKAHLNQHYGLNDETITSYALGYSTGEGLSEHLHGLGHTAKQIISTGLFVNVGDSWPEFFNHRLVFPYWKNGQAVYFIGRHTNRTPDKKWEKAKYKKLPTHAKHRPYISQIIKNDWFYGEDSIRGADRVFVAEGVTDCLAMLQAGYPTISPVTTRFRSADMPRLQELTRNANNIYFVPDNEKNLAGIKGAMDTATKLEGR